MRALSLLLAAVAAHGSSQPSADLMRARLRVEAALVAVQACSRHAETAEEELRAEGTQRLARAAFGSGYDAVQAHEILERMFLWLAGPEARATALAEPSGLVERAARAAHPAIADGLGLRGAAHWASFVEAAAQTAAANRSFASASRVASSRARQSLSLSE